VVCGESNIYVKGHSMDRDGPQAFGQKSCITSLVKCFCPPAVPLTFASSKLGYENFIYPQLHSHS